MEEEEEPKEEDARADWVNERVGDEGGGRAETESFWSATCDCHACMCASCPRSAVYITPPGRSRRCVKDMNSAESSGLGE